MRAGRLLLGAAIACVAMSLCACQREPDFDERYASTEKSIREKAKDIDAQMAEADRQANEAAAALAPASPAVQATAMPRR